MELRALSCAAIELPISSKWPNPSSISSSDRKRGKGVIQVQYLELSLKDGRDVFLKQLELRG